MEKTGAENFLTRKFSKRFENKNPPEQRPTSYSIIKKKKQFIKGKLNRIIKKIGHSSHGNKIVSRISETERIKTIFSSEKYNNQINQEMDDEKFEEKFEEKQTSISQFRIPNEIDRSVVLEGNELEFIREISKDSKVKNENERNNEFGGDESRDNCLKKIENKIEDFLLLEVKQIWVPFK
jgi:hypothetical protein